MHLAAGLHHVDLIQSGCLADDYSPADLYYSANYTAYYDSP